MAAVGVVLGVAAVPESDHIVGGAGRDLHGEHAHQHQQQGGGHTRTGNALVGQQQHGQQPGVDVVVDPELPQPEVGHGLLPDRDPGGLNNVSGHR
ncbi:hypothetical protein [Nocardia crassostreae]|uniref:hypothetical protein n=1 Tax=Nocardia crassostreae TaxID=53428 RepID=UPI0012F8376E|nr:hypothetical protein [Nocardia crassostreae]